MKVNVTLLLIAITLSAVGYASFLRTENHRLRLEEERAYGNLRAEIAASDSLKNQSKLYRMTIDELEQRGDSISIALLKTKKELKVKDKDLKALAEFRSAFSTKDTLVLRDTIFAPGVSVDTILGDEWYKLRLALRYPDTLRTDLSVLSKKHIVVHTRRFIRKPSKIFFIRWFQKRSTEVIVDVKDLNPYISEEGSRFVEIVN